MHVFFISVYAPAPRSGGGPRRSHQVLYELQEFFGAENVTLIRSDEILPNVRSVGTWFHRMIGRCKRTVANPLQLLSRERYGIAHIPPGALRRYRQLLERVPGPKLCVLENPRLAALTATNDRMGIKTVMAPWSFESFTNNLAPMISTFGKMKARRATILDSMNARAILTSFANELIFNARATRTWCLSRLEDHFLQASGITSGYFPYYPIGESDDCLVSVRRERRPELGLFVICGGANGQNMLALQSFLQSLKRNDIPAGARIAITGLERLPEDWASHLGAQIEFVGSLEEECFHSLLSRSHAVLIPQRCGFGCMTRIPDMLCAGIPVVADAIVANGNGEVPGVRYLEDTPGAWASALREEMAKLPVVFPAEDYHAWQQAQRLMVKREFERVAKP